MCCCNDIIVPFTDVEETIIPYPSTFTRMPIITVGYENTDGSITQIGIFTEARITSDSIQVYHGGPASGIIRITI